MAIQALSPHQARGAKIFVYRNLHQNCWSVKSRETGRVIAHADHVELSDVEFKVSQAGRERVLREKSKNVHAGLQGKLMDFDPVGSKMRTYPAATFSSDASGAAQAPKGDDQPVSITYNPYKYSSFVVRATEQPVHSAETAVLRNDRQVLAHYPTLLAEVG